MIDDGHGHMAIRMGYGPCGVWRYMCMYGRSSPEPGSPQRARGRRAAAPVAGAERGTRRRVLVCWLCMWLGL
jgi:hypothetical protein